ncbi:MAG: hypothetical protein K2O34_10845 [Acetatifactor sp.]|nr:hypothetical protein [Acetatifactor sp.]
MDIGVNNIWCYFETFGIYSRSAYADENSKKCLPMIMIHLAIDYSETLPFGEGLFKLLYTETSY